jgi:hypothetical protein
MAPESTAGRVVNIREGVSSTDDSPVVRMFGRIHKRALGVAVGTAAALLVFTITAFHIVLRPTEALNIILLSEYFYGYEITWRGAVIGACWAFWTGFVAGWFVAFVRNVWTGIRLFTLRHEGELISQRDFLDYL